jgi:hypothetical protein
VPLDEGGLNRFRSRLHPLRTFDEYVENDISSPIQNPDGNARLLCQKGGMDMAWCLPVANRLLTCCVVVGALLAVSEPMLAHHGQVVYQRKSITLKGAVTKYEWSNPHSVITLAVKNEKPGADEWYLEVLPPTQMLQAGWNKESLKPGDEITVTGRPGKNGERIMWLEYLVTADGRKLSRE